MVKSEVIKCTGRTKGINLYLTGRLCWRCPAECPLCNVEVNNIGSAGQGSFTQRIVVKTAIEFVFFHIAKSRSKTKLSFMKRNR